VTALRLNCLLLIKYCWVFGKFMWW